MPFSKARDSLVLFLKSKSLLHRVVSVQYNRHLQNEIDSGGPGRTCHFHPKVICIELVRVIPIIDRLFRGQTGLWNHVDGCYGSVSLGGFKLN